jgi:hypothetical protein
MGCGGEGEYECGAGRPFTARFDLLYFPCVVVESLGVKEVGGEESLLCMRVDPER